jgi:hypothetical protein
MTHKNYCHTRHWNRPLCVAMGVQGDFQCMSEYSKNFSVSQLRFCPAHRYRKINKGRRADSCESSEAIDSGFKGLLYLSGVSRLQPSLLRIRLMWLRDFSVLKNGPGALSDFSGHFSGSGRVVRLVFAWFWGSGELGRVVWGDKTKTRHFSGSLGCVGRQHP